MKTRLVLNRIYPLFIFFSVAATSLSETVSGFKVSSSPTCSAPFQWCNDQVRTRYTVVLGEGFDPTKNYFYIRPMIYRTAHAGGTTFWPNGEQNGNDAPFFQVRSGVVTAPSGTPANTFNGHLGLAARISNENATDIWTWIGDGNLYDTMTGEVVGYISDVSARAEIIPICGSTASTCETKYLNIRFTINYGKRKDDCEKCEPCAGSPGATSSALSSVDTKINVGKGDFGSVSGYLWLKSELPSTILGKPSSLLGVFGSDVEVIKDTNGFRQILSSQALVDVLTNNTYGYSLRFYPSAQAGTKTNGLYSPTNAPYKIVTIENPDAATNHNRLFVSEAQDGTTNLTQYVFNTTNSQWTFEAHNGAQKEILSRSWNSNNTERTETKTVHVSGSNTNKVYEEQKVYRVFAWGEELIAQTIDPNGAALTTTWEYYTNSAISGSYSQLKQRTGAHGYWERYEYDNSRRMTNKVTTFLNATNGAPESQARVVSTIFSTSNPRETIIEKLLGQEVGRTYKAYYADVAQKLDAKHLARPGLPRGI